MSAREVTNDLSYPAPVQAVPGEVPVETLLRIQQFLYREARLLDEHRYDEWLASLTEDVHYWAPGIQSRYRKDAAGRFDERRMAHFDDGLRDLETRAARFAQHTAWGEDPPTRQCHVVTNVEVEPTAGDGEWLAHSLLVSVRNRNEDEEDWLCLRRKDKLIETSDGLRLAARYMFLSQAVLLSKNINTFL